MVRGESSYPESGFQTVQNMYGKGGKLSSLCGNFPHCLETFHDSWKLATLSGNFPDGLETFQTGWKLSKLAGNFLDWLESFKTGWKFSSCIGLYKALLSCAWLYWVCTRVVESDFRKSNKSRMPKSF